MRGTNARVPLRMPQRLTPSVHAKSAAGLSHMRPPANTPALLHRTSTPLCSAKTRSASVATESASLTSVMWSVPSMSAPMTCMPSAVNRSTSARPMPLAAPVTTATLPRSCSIGASWQRMASMSERIEKLLVELTLDEKAALVAGIDLWHGPGVPRLGIPALKVTDGPSGARGEQWSGRPSANFPCGSALGATWNPELVREIGVRLGVETKRKNAHALLAPTVNIHRHPLAGRNFECYSEDPFLSARIAVAYITGVQSQGVACTVKHFVANDSEFERMTISSELDERTLREISLVPFEAAVTEAGTWAIMTAYNRVHGTYCSEHAPLLTLLRDEWGFDGVVMSDWYGT